MNTKQTAIRWGLSLRRNRFSGGASPVESIMPQDSASSRSIATRRPNWPDTGRFAPLPTGCCNDSATPFRWGGCTRMNHATSTR